MWKDEFKFLHFVRLADIGSRMVFSCQTKRNEELGRVEWYGPWKQYCYYPLMQAVYSDGCLKDIASFVKQVNETRTEDIPAPK